VTTHPSSQELLDVPRPGSVLLGKYRIERVLGVGGMGAVVEARHLQLDDRVAIKFLLSSMVRNAEVVERFLREGRAASKIRGEHVVRVFDVGTLETGAPYMVMEFLEGTDLAQHLEASGPLRVAQAVDWVLEASEAIAEAHAAGIVHRDLKPANLYVTTRPDGTPFIKVLDFGISKIGSTTAGGTGLTKTSAVMGSPRYMSPEQMKSSRNVDARSDIWALGTVLYEALAGVPPFDADTVPELCVRIVMEPPPPLHTHRPDLPQGFEAALMLALAKEPASRYQTVADFCAALAPYGSPQAAVSATRAARVLKMSAGAAVGAASTGASTARAATGPTHAQWAGSTPAVPKASRAGVLIAAVALLSLVGLGTVGGWWAARRSLPATAASSSAAAAPLRSVELPAVPEAIASAPAALPDAGLTSIVAPPSPRPATPTPHPPPAAQRPAPAAAPPAPAAPHKPVNPFEER
jgi:serine/threonine-protein kinase